MNRREFLRRAGTIALTTNMGNGAWGLAKSTPVPALYYVDGYHGGSRGHMPTGCWRDILEAMQARPDWKLSLDIEASSWEVLKREDPEAYLELKDYVESGGETPRVEIVGGTFSQPYGWVISGESNIRQLQRGLELIGEHFASTRIETYAVQEPCWASCMPQILRSMGFNGAALKNASTAWGGYTKGIDSELVNWIGSDGSSIVTVPRYTCEELLGVWETEAAHGAPDYVQKCTEHGIAEPVGMCFQDLGWPAKPRVSAEYIRFVTWKEYIHRIAKAHPQDWSFTMEDILTTLPWGEKTLQKVAQQVRAAEIRLVMAEKMATMAWLQTLRGWPTESLHNAWDQALWGQAHDAWITATTRSGRQAWSFQVAAETLDAEEAAQSIISESAMALSTDLRLNQHHPLGTQSLRLFNSHPCERRGLVEVQIATDRRTQYVKVMDKSGADVQCQLVATRRYLPQATAEALSERGEVSATGADASNDGINAGTLLFLGNVPSFGFSAYRVTPAYEPRAKQFKGGVSVAFAADGNIFLESDLYRIRIDPKLGGAVTSLYSKELGKEFCSGKSDRLFNEYRGYFISQQKWRSSTESSAEIETLESGPVRAKVRVSGEIGGCPFQTILTLVQGQRRIQFQVTFKFEQDTWIGDPWDIKPEDRNKERRRSQNDGRWKLQALFPSTLDHCALYKNGAFDVCRSRNVDTYFQRWDEIKHNIILNWVDIHDEQQDCGLAVFSDRTTAYTFGPDHPLALVLGWGAEGGFWWGKCPLRGEQQASYSVMPHSGKWDAARLWHENAEIEEPLLAQLMDGQVSPETDEKSLIRVSPATVCLSAAQVKKDHLEVRLFNADNVHSDCSIAFGFPVSRVEVVELDGRLVEDLAISATSPGYYRVKVEIPRFGIRTLRLALTPANKR